MKWITILGSTGSIGTQALEVIAVYPDLFRIYALTAGRNVSVLIRQARRFKPQKVVIADESKYAELKTALAGLPVEVLAGSNAISQLAAEAQPDLVLNALVGFAGLKPTLSALHAGKNVALANKETLVAGGHLVMPLAQKAKKTVIPVDSEHSAIFQCLQGQENTAVENIILTASGGPFFGYTLGQLRTVNVEDALKHPNWTMGKKITIDSATMMNKGLEVIEAHWLFGLDYDKIKVVIHRQSIIHSMVTFQDGAVLAQLGAPDMRLPIQYALTYPQRLKLDVPRLQWEEITELNFSAPDHENFPCLKLAYEAGRIGGTMPAVLNAANEEAVSLFLQGKISFLAVARIIEAVMNKHKVVTAPDYETLTATDRQARLLARQFALEERVRKC
ncbi:MAG: 1-deoxy-D-xylulose-5-phosphate reductoisomerase [Firmicutes bacterium]|nr:1-deoxy-D-xylulose-5-phosphate reductoisomerase [Bacillota bacterium]